MGKATKIMTPPGHVVRCMDGQGYTEKAAGNLSALKAVRMKCLDCSGGQHSEVRQCSVPQCPLFPFRCAVHD